MKKLLFLAPGAGLGHLNRCLALAIEAKEFELDAIILTSSLFAKTLSAMSGIQIIELPMNKWVAGVEPLVEDLDPDIIFLDSFPFGIRNEWSKIPAEKKCIYLARHLKIAAYFNKGNMHSTLRDFDKIVILESLEEKHQEMISDSGVETISIKAITIADGDLIVQIPSRLKDLMVQDYQLIVHSGPDTELQQLVYAAEKFDERIIIIAPRVSYRNYDVFDFYPAKILFPKATRIFSGAGYNSMADLIPYTGKSIIIPFERTYDNQAWRISNPHTEYQKDFSILFEKL